MHAEAGLAEIQNGMECETPFQLWAERAFEFAKSHVYCAGDDIEPAIVERFTSISRSIPACVHGPWEELGTHDKNLEYIVRCATTAMTMRFGHTAELACVVFAYLFSRGKTCKFFDLPLVSGSHHYFVVVGPDDNAMNELGWVCDPCCGCYPIVQIHSQLGTLLGGGIPLENAICRAVNMNEDQPICFDFVEKVSQHQMDQLSLAGIRQVPCLGEMSRFEQLQWLQNLL